MTSVHSKDLTVCRSGYQARTTSQKHTRRYGSQQVHSEGHASFVAAQDLAPEHSHQLSTPVHLVAALLNEDGTPRQVLSQIGTEQTWQSTKRVITKRLVRLPSISPKPNEITASPDLQKDLHRAAKLQKDKGDASLGVDLLLLALLDS